MAAMPEPSAENDYLADHIALLRRSLQRLTGRALVDPSLSGAAAAQAAFEAPFALLSHDTAGDPIFTYANRTAMTLFGMEWEAITTLPSRHSAETLRQEERDRLLRAVTEHGYIDDYNGVRIAKDGRRFRIEAATVWNLYDENGTYRGQAACFSHWTML